MAAAVESLTTIVTQRAIPEGVVQMPLSAEIQAEFEGRPNFVRAIIALQSKELPKTPDGYVWEPLSFNEAKGVTDGVFCKVGTTRVEGLLSSNPDVDSLRRNSDKFVYILDRNGLNPRYIVLTTPTPSDNRAAMQFPLAS